MPAVSMPAPGPEPLSPTSALLIINAVGALLLSTIASKQAGSFIVRFGVLFGAIYSLDTLLPLSEGLLFEDVLQIPRKLFAVAAGVGLTKALCGASAAAFFFRSSGRQVEDVPRLLPRLAVAAGLYLVLYFAAGYAIAWQSPTVRAFYGNGLDVPSPVILAVSQLLRGFWFATIAAILLRGLTGSRLQRILLVAGAFGVLMALPLLLPNAAMPWSVRRVHLLELAVSNFLFGVGSAVILTGQSSRRTHEQASGGKLHQTAANRLV